MPCNESEEDQLSDDMPSTRRRRQKRPKRGADFEESDEEEMNSRSEGTDELLVDKADANGMARQSMS